MELPPRSESDDDEPQGTQTAAMVVVQSGGADEELLRMVAPDATAKDIEAGMSGCVVHLCGCK